MINKVHDTFLMTSSMSRHTLKLSSQEFLIKIV